MGEEMYWTCDWTGCTEAVSLSADEAKQWHHGSYDYGEEERNDTIDLCPLHGEQLQQLIGA